VVSTGDAWIWVPKCSSMRESEVDDRDARRGVAIAATVEGEQRSGSVFRFWTSYTLF
jgi:hypothetical protein